MRLPPDVLDYFRKQGARGGKIGGKLALETMTPAERSARASKAGKVGGKRALETMTPAERSARAKKASIAGVAARQRKARAAKRAKPLT